MRTADIARLLARAIPYGVRYALASARRVPPTPLALSFLVTARCPLECRHCFYHRAPRDAAAELSLDEYRAISRSLGPLAFGLFCGGEPYVRPDLAEIVSTFRRENGVLVTLVSTNGQLTESVVGQTQAILRARPASPFILSMSLDGFREEHDHLRGKGAFDRALRTWRECQVLARHHPHLALGISTVVSRVNQATAGRFVRWLWRELRPESVGVLLVRQSPRDGADLKRVRADEYLAAQREALSPLTDRKGWPLRCPQALYFGAMARGIHQTMISGARSFRCLAGRHGAVVDPTGNLFACEALAETQDPACFGSLRDVGLRFDDLWLRRGADPVRASVGRHAICAACTHETMGYLPSLPFDPRAIVESYRGWASITGAPPC